MIKALHTLFTEKELNSHCHPLVIGLLSFLLGERGEVMLAFNELSVYNWLILIRILCKNRLSKMESVASGVLIEYYVGSSSTSTCGGCGCYD